MSDKALLETGGTLKSAPYQKRFKKCVIRLFIFIHYNLFLIELKLKKCVIKLLILVHLYLILLLIDISLKTWCDKIVFEDSFMLKGLI